MTGKVLATVAVVAVGAFAATLAVHIAREVRWPPNHPRAITADDLARFRRTVEQA